MRNLLSLNMSPISGKELKGWIKYHCENDTEYTSIARRLKRFSEGAEGSLQPFYPLSDAGTYLIDLRPSGSACGEKKRYHPIIRKFKK